MNRKSIASRILMILLCLTLIAELPLANTRADNGGSTTASNNLLNIDGKEPETFKQSTEDPYGYGKGVPFLLSEENELMLLYGANSQKSDRVQALQYYETLKYDKDSKVSSIHDGVARSAFASSNYVTSAVIGSLKINFSQAVAFDPTGSGRKDHVALIGITGYVDNNQNRKKEVWIKVYNTRTKVWSGNYFLGKMNWVDETGSDYYQMKNYLSITAGDFDGDHKDSIVVYAAIDQNRNVSADNLAYGLFELDYINDAISRRFENGDHSLLNSAYVANQGYLLTYRDKNNNICNSEIDDDGRQMLVVDLDSGDINHDGIDDLVVLSYVNDIGGDTKKNYNCNIAVPYLAVSYGAPKTTSKTIVRNIDGLCTANYVRGTSSTDKNDIESFVTIRAAGVAVANVDSNQNEEIIVAGKKVTMTLQKGTTKFDKWSAANTLTIAKYSHSTSDNKPKLTGTFTETQSSLNTFTDWSIWDATNYDHTWPKLELTGVAMNGRGNPSYVFISGDIYDFSQGNPSKLYTIDYFTAHDEGANENPINVNFVNSVAAGNFDGNTLGFEQVIYTTGLKQSGADDYTFGMGVVGLDNSKRDSETHLFPDDNPVFYATSKKAHSNGYVLSNKGDNLEEGLMCLAIAVDNDNDGVLARYSDKTMAYSDPEVLAILQAAPYYDALQEVCPSGGETKYGIEESVSITTGTSNSVSFGVGASIEMSASIWSLELKAGYSLDWSESFETTVSHTISHEFSTSSNDSVIVYRTPVKIYCYDTSTSVNSDGTPKWEKNAVCITTACEPLYQQLSIPEYNEFVQQFNTNNEKAIMTPIINPGNYYLGIEGNPYKYMDVTDATDRISATGHALAYNGSTDSAGGSWSTEYAHTVEEAHGFSFEAAAKVGFGTRFVQADAGIYASLEYLHGKSTTHSSGKGVIFSGSIENPNTTKLDPELTAQIKSYGFTWYLCKWDSNIPTYKKDSSNNPIYVPIIGYCLDNVESLPNPMENVFVAPYEIDTDLTHGYFVLSWDDPNLGNSSLYPKCASYNIYRYDKDGYALAGSSKTTTFTYGPLDGRASYQFIVVGVNSAGIETLPSAPGYRFLDTYTVGISGIDKTNSTNLEDTYTITFTNGKKQEYVVNNGVGIDSIALTDKQDLVDTYTITMNDGSTESFSVTNGAEGVGITKIEKTKTEGLLDTYTITLGNNETYTFCVMNGKDGADGQNGKDGKDGTDGKDGQNGENGKDGVDGQNGTDGKDGKNGKNGSDGSNGTNGRDGSNGTNGRDGNDGRNGNDGRDGADGQNNGNGQNGSDGQDGQDGMNGQDGTSIVSSEIDENGHLIITYSNGTKQDVGKVVGENGQDGKDGINGTNGVDGVAGAAGTNGKDGIPWAVVGVLGGWNTLLTVAVILNKRGRLKG